MPSITSFPDRGWLRHLERDAMALGGPLFYVLVVGRGLVGPFWDLVVPLVVIGAILLVGHRRLRGFDLYLTRALVIAVLVTNHYGDAVFGAFAAVIFAFLVYAAADLGSPRPAIVGGLTLGVAAAAVGYLLAVPFG